MVTRFQRRKWRDGPRLAAASILALLAHIAFIGIFILLSFIEVNLPGRPPKRHSPNPVVLRGLSAQQWAKNRGQLKVSPSDESEPVVAQRPKPPEQKKPREDASGSSSPSPAGRTAVGGNDIANKIGRRWSFRHGQLAGSIRASSLCELRHNFLYLFMS